MMQLRALCFALLGLVCWATSASAGGKFLSYEVNGLTYEGYYASAGDKAPLVLLVHDWDGLTDYEVKRSQMLVEQGYSVFAADLFGKGVRPTEVVDKRQHTGELYQDRTKMRALLNGSLAAAAQQGADTKNAVAMGYCFGGAAVLEMARSGAELKGFATFHGGLNTPEGQDYKQVKAPVLIMHGTADVNIPMTQFADLAARMEADGAVHEMVSYSGAPHAFTVFGSARYQERADKKSWQQFLGFLKESTD